MLQETKAQERKEPPGWRLCPVATWGHMDGGVEGSDPPPRGVGEESESRRNLEASKEALPGVPQSQKKSS